MSSPLRNIDNPAKSSITPQSNPQPAPRHTIPAQTNGDKNNIDIEIDHMPATTPLISHLSPSFRPRLAQQESTTELDDDDRETVSKPYPGVDDGFFKSRAGENPKDDAPENPDEVENIGPTVGAENPVDIPPSAATPTPPRTDPEGGHNDEPDGSKNGAFPFAPGYEPHNHNHDVERGPGSHGTGNGGGFEFDLDSNMPDVNVYQHKKTLAQGMMDLALFSANANQLRYVLESYTRHPYYYPSVILISFSLIIQVGIGIGLIWNSTFNVKIYKDICTANRINNATVIGIFLVTVVNVFISAFGVADPAPDRNDP